MLTGITLENFKAFKEPQFIPIKPITLVFGPNSAGKSSILHALAFLKYVHYSYGHCDPETVEYGWDKIHLGSWHNLVHGHDANATMRITLHFESCAIMWAFKKCKHGPRVDSFVFYENQKEIARGDNKEKDNEIPMIQWSVELHACHPFWNVLRDEIWNLATGEREAQESANGVAADDGFFEGSRNPEKDGLMKGFRSAFDAYFNNWIGDSWKKAPDHEPRNNTPYRKEMQTLFPGLGALFFTDGPNHFWRIDDDDGDNLCLHEQNLIGKFFPSEKILRQIGEFGESLVTATTDPESGRLVFDSVLDRRSIRSLISLKSLQEMFPGQNDNPVTRPRHVGAFRSAPESKLTRNNMVGRPDLKPWFELVDGGITMDFVNGSLEKLQIPYKIAVRKIQYSAFMPGERNCKEPPKVEVSSSDEELVFMDRNNVAHPIRSLGSGLGVILPILVELVFKYASFRSVEEPESHIHPKLQAELGDIVIESTLGGHFRRHGLGPDVRTFIETHSEHLILRILRRIRETTRGKLPEDAVPVRPEDIAVLYVEPGDEGATARVLRINDQGRFVDDWPNGFFEERFNEEF